MIIDNNPSIYLITVRVPAITLRVLHMGGSQKRCTKGGDRVRVCITSTHLLSIKKINIGDFHVSVAINI